MSNSPTDDSPSFDNLGWREWAALPALGIEAIKMKVDTGARTSCLHAFSTDVFERDGQRFVRFGIHPEQGNNDKEIWCEAEIIDERQVSDSGGHKEMRPVIRQNIVVGHYQWPIELTLTNRDTMRFRMLLGRTAMGSFWRVCPAQSYLQGEPDLHDAVPLTTGKNVSL